MKQLTTQDFFFCYTKVLSDFLKEKDIPYILKSRSIKDGNVFTLYEKTDQLQEALREYKVD